MADTSLYGLPQIFHATEMYIQTLENKLTQTITDEHEQRGHIKLKRDDALREYLALESELWKMLHQQATPLMVVTDVIVLSTGADGGVPSTGVEGGVLSTGAEGGVLSTATEATTTEAGDTATISCEEKQKRAWARAVAWGTDVNNQNESDDCDSSSDGDHASPGEDTAMIDTATIDSPDTFRVKLSANLLEDAPGQDDHTETEKVADDDDNRTHDTESDSVNDDHHVGDSKPTPSQGCMLRATICPQQAAVPRAESAVVSSSDSEEEEYTSDSDSGENENWIDPDSAKHADMDISASDTGSSASDSDDSNASDIDYSTSSSDDSNASDYAETNVRKRNQPRRSQKISARRDTTDTRSSIKSRPQKITTKNAKKFKKTQNTSSGGSFHSKTSLVELLVPYQLILQPMLACSH